MFLLGKEKGKNSERKHEMLESYNENGNFVVER